MNQPQNNQNRPPVMPDFQQLERYRIDNENKLKDEIRTKQETILILEDENKELIETVKRLRQNNEKLTALCMSALEHIIIKGTITKGE